MVSEHVLADAEELLVGSSDSADIRIEDPSVARAHAKIYASGGQVFIQDLGSEGGTYVEGRQVASPVRLTHRQQILVGQRAVVRPFVLRFEDPSAQILIELGIDEESLPHAESSDSGASEDGEKQEAVHAEKSRRPSPELTPPPSSNASLQSGARGAGQAAPGHRPRASVRRRGATPLLAAVLGLSALGLAAWGLLQVLRPSSAVWRTVQISPPSLTAGAELILQSPDIHPGDDLEVFVANEQVAELARRRGRFVATVPNVDPRAAGVYNVPLVVKRRDIEIYQRMVEYAVQPVITSVSPEAPEVGDILTIAGSGFADSPSEVKVRLGDEWVTPRESSPGRIALRVPVLTRKIPVRAPIEVAIGDWTAAAPDSIVVHSRTERPMSLDFRAAYDADREGWLVSYALGPAFYLVSEPPGTDSDPDWLPDDVAGVLDRWNKVFELAATEPDLEIGVKSDGGRSVLVAKRIPASESFEIVAWDDADLVRYSSPGGDVSASILCYRMASIWNQLLDVFSRGSEIPAGLGLPVYGSALNRLVVANMEGGGRGRPERRELDLLTTDDRVALERAFLPIPKGLGSVAGQWRIALENVFLADKQLGAVLTVDLKQRRGRLFGEASLSVASDSMRWSLPSTPVSGRLDIRQPTQVKLEMTFGNPVGRLVLEGATLDNALAGTFRASRGTRPGAWRAERQVASGDRPKPPRSDENLSAWVLDR